MNRFKEVLLVDDDESINRFHEIILRRTGFTGEILKAKNGQVALDILIKNDNKINPDLIFLDLNMPVMDGFRFLQLYTNSKEYYLSKPKIIVLTTSLMPEEKRKALDNKNISMFINKPMSKDSLLRLLQKV